MVVHCFRSTQWGFVLWMMTGSIRSVYWYSKNTGISCSPTPKLNRLSILWWQLFTVVVIVTSAILSTIISWHSPVKKHFTDPFPFWKITVDSWIFFFYRLWNIPFTTFLSILKLSPNLNSGSCSRLLYSFSICTLTLLSGPIRLSKISSISPHFFYWKMVLRNQNMELGILMLLVCHCKRQDVCVYI